MPKGVRDVGFTLQQLADEVGARVVGDPACRIEGVATLFGAGVGEIAFLSNSKYRKFLAGTAASAVILAEADVAFCATNALVVADPYLAYAKIAARLTVSERPVGMIHPSAVIAASARVAGTAFIAAHCVVEDDADIGDEVFLGPGCVVGRGSRIGERSRLVANVTICHGVVVGLRALVHPGAVIGSDGFGLANDRGRWVKVPQLGGVNIGDDVEIGANTTIDRGAIEDTVIENGVKLDNLIQIAHNVRVGAHSAIAAQVGIAGSAKIGARCVIAGQCGIAGHIEIADGTQFTGMSMVTKSVSEAGVYSSGIPAEPNRLWRRNVARFRQLEQLEKRIKALEAQFEQEKG